MIGSKIGSIYWKELVESIRDRRTILATVLVPVLLYPAMFMLLAETTQRAAAKRSKAVYKVAVVSQEAADKFQNLFDGLRDSWINEDSDTEKGKEVKKTNKDFSNEKKKDFPQFSFEKSEDPKGSVETGKFELGLLEKGKFEELIGNEKTAEYELFYDSAENRSASAYQSLFELISTYSKQERIKRLKNRNLTKEFINPIEVSQKDLAPPVKQSGSFLGMILPLIFIMMIISGAIYPAIDLTAGEKERSTLEALMAEPVSPLELIAGKFLTVATVAFTTAILNVGSFALTMLIVGVNSLPQFQFPWHAIPVTLLILLPLTLFFSAVLIAVSSLAKSNKEAQVYCMPVYLAPMLGLFGTIVPGIELEGPLLILPVINSALLIKELFLGHDVVRPFAFVFCSTCIYAAAAIGLAARLFAREEVLFSADGRFRLLLGRRFIKPTLRPKTTEALLVAAVLFPFYFFFAASINQLGEITFYNMIVPQILLLLALPWATTWYIKVDKAETFLWKMPSFRGLLSGIFLGSSSWILAQQFLAVQSRFWSYSPAADGGVLEKLITDSSLFTLIAVIAVTPALCEEHFFRGFFMSGLREKMSKRTIILLSGFVFGIFHYSLFRQPITTVLGFALAYVALESGSLLPGVIFHFLHNGITATHAFLSHDYENRLNELPWYLDIAKNENLEALTEAGRMPDVRMEWLIGAVVVFVLGLLLARGSSKTKT